MLIKQERARDLAYLNSLWKLFRALHQPESIEALWFSLMELKGPILKIVQVLSGIPGLWSASIAARLQLVSSTCSPLSSFAWAEHLKSEVPHWYSKFSLKECYGGALGQVHKVFWNETEFRACKVQYPNMHAILKQDFQRLNLWRSVYQWWGAAVDTSEILQYLYKIMEQELDYQQEGEWMQWFHQHFQDIPWIHIPFYYSEASSKNILMMSWLQGKNFSQEALVELPQKIRDILSYRLLYAWYQPFFSKGILHADPHMTNYMWNQEGHIYMLDFGCVQHFSPSWIEGTKALYTALLNKEETQGIYYEYFGFSPLSEVQKACIDQWAKFLYGPFLVEGPRILPESMTQNGLHLLKQLHHTLQCHGPVRIPLEFLLLDRSCIALGSTLIRLKGALCWKTCFQSVMEEDIPKPYPL
ncbi:AarF/UbiB family protein [Holospora curviuscula]|uniref:ABC1 atypical kinase-like domain-containing protein n=1 Tax=Holospora curviuscula TaxID=1082868 RepID=A0A2S5R928_9PROT|nr:AarF/UbiB family protein [Holospora curviuscula]PPE03826.1 putative protein kinase UbiB [Holospora curviuscula]